MQIGTGCFNKKVQFGFTQEKLTTLQKQKQFCDALGDKTVIFAY